MKQNVLLIIPPALLFLGVAFSLVIFSLSQPLHLTESALRDFPIDLAENPTTMEETSLYWSPRGLGEKQFVLCSLTENKLSHGLFQAINDQIDSNRIPISMDLIFSFNCPEDIFLQPSVRSGIVFLVAQTKENYICTPAPVGRRTHSTLDLVALFQHSIKGRKIQTSDKLCKKFFFQSPFFLSEMQKYSPNKYLDSDVLSSPRSLFIFLGTDPGATLIGDASRVVVDIIRAVSGISKNFHSGATPWVATSSGNVVAFLSFQLPFYCFVFSLVFSGIFIYMGKKSNYVISVKWKSFWAPISAVLTFTFYLIHFSFFLALCLCILLFHSSRNAIWLFLTLFSAFIVVLFHSSSPLETLLYSAIMALQLLCISPAFLHCRRVRVCAVLFSLITVLWSNVDSFAFRSSYFMLTDISMLSVTSQIISIMIITDFLAPQG